MMIYYLFLLVSSGNGEIAIEMADNCNASCLGDVRETWPPEGFAEPEERVRCSLRCPSNDPTKVSIGTGILPSTSGIYKIIIKIK